MKTIFNIGILFFYLPIFGQGELPQILEEHFLQVGQEQWDQVDDVTIDGRWVDEDYHGYPVDVLVKRPGKIRIEGNYNGQQFIEAVDGEQAWILAPWKDSYAVQAMTFEEKLILQNSFSFGSAISAVKDKVRFNGLVDYKGIIYLTLVYEYPLGKETFIRTFYLDRKTYQLQLETYKWGKEGFLEKIYDKYRDYGPLSVPIAVQFQSQNLEKELIFDEIFIGLGIKDQLFLPSKGQ